MDKTEAAILSLVRSGLLGGKCEIDAQIDWGRLYSISFRHGIISIVYNALKNSNISVPNEFLRLFQVEALRYVRQDYHQRSEIKAIFGELEKNGIRYIPLKGIIMKNLYPKPEYRWMSDADIFIDESQVERILPCMKNLGYKYKEHLSHEFTLEKDELFQVELHTLALDPQNKLIDEYFKDSFSFAYQIDGMQYQYNDNDMLLHAICHLFKHFMYDLGNLRNVIDIYYLLQAPSLDIIYVDQKLREWKLDRFFDVVQRTVNDWFGKKEFDERETLFLSSILRKSETLEHKWEVVSTFIRNEKENKKKSGGRRIRNFFSTLFPPYSVMKRGYIILERIPILLPFFWVWRIISVLLFKRDHLKNYVGVLKNSEESVDQYIKVITAVGLKDMLSSEE